MINEQGYGAIYPYTWWGNRQDLGFGTSYPFLLNRYGGAAAAYSLRSLSSDNLNVVRVRRDSDNAERDFKATEVTDGTLQNWVNGSLDDLPLDTATAAAAYSLRNLKSDYSGSVVRVRRSSDNAEADFTAAEVSDGTLESWVNTDVVRYESDFTSTEDLNEYNGIGAAAQSVDGVSDAYKFTLSGGNVQHTVFTAASTLESGKSFTIVFDYYIPSGQAFSSIVFDNLGGSGAISGSLNVTDDWTTETINFTADGTRPRWWAGALNTNVNADGDVFYLKNIRVTQLTADGFVTTWYDQAGSNNATQATASSQPKIVDAGSLVTENGKAALDFDRVLGLVNHSFSLSQPNTNIVVGTMDTVNSVFFDGDANSTRQFIYGDTSVGFRFFAGLTGVEGLPFNSNQNLHFGNAEGLNSSYYINSVLRDNGNAGANPLADLRIGSAITGAAPLDGKIQEVLFYSGNQSSNRVKIENNINTYYNIYSSLIDGYVATWYDQSGNSNDATQATASAQPMIVDSGVLVRQGGRASISFDGSDDYLFNSFGSALTQPINIYNVVTYPTKDISRYLFDSDGPPRFTLVRENFRLRLYTGVALDLQESSYTFYTGQQYLLSVSGNSSSSYISVNGSIEKTGNAGTGGMDGITIGSYYGIGLYGNVKYQELVIFDNASNKSDIESNINTYYTIYPEDAISGLLFDYPNAAAAYSVRQLTLYSNDYKETLVRVRRSSDNAEVDVKADSNYEISLNSDTSSGLSLGDWIGSDDGFVSVWYDQSNNDYDAEQTTASSQPQLITGGVVNLENGKASLNFDGTDDYMTSPSVALSTNNIALFNILKLNSSTFATWFSYGGYILNGFLIQRPNNSYARYAVSGSSYEDFNDFSSLPSTTNQILLSLIDYDSNSSVYIDNVLQGTKTISVSLNSSKTIELGRRTDNNTQYTPMNAQEFIFYPTDQSANRTNIETNINDYFNIY